MDGYDLLLDAMAFLSRIIPISLFFRHGYPFLSLSLFLGDASLARHGAFIMWNEWMVMPIPSVGI